MDTSFNSYEKTGAPAAAKLSPLDRAYRRCVTTFLMVFFGGIGLIYAFLVVVDPYDTGRFPTLLPAGIVGVDTAAERRTTVVSRGHDPHFNAAIFGNSRTFMLDPVKLSEATGYRFVSLGTPGAGPREEMLVIRYFLRFHPGAEAIVFGIDERWCTHDPSMPILMRFPFWLYRGDLEYLENLLSTRGFKMAWSRIELAMGRIAPINPRGYINYDAGAVSNFHPPAAPKPFDAAPEPVEANSYFPALEEFDGLLAELPPQAKFVIMMPPAYQTSLPHPGTQEAADLAACKAGVARRLGHQGIALLDYLVDGAIARDPANFLDKEHYRTGIAHIIEDGIIDALNRGANGETGAP
jgi:hypothetical protein